MADKTMRIEPLRDLRRVYCAGPLFNEAERREMLQIAGVLSSAGFEPFVPHSDGMEFALVHPYLVEEGYEPAAAGRLLHEAVFALDTFQVVLGCGSLVLNLNGRVPDEGAVAEATMAWMLGKPLVIFKEDARSAIAGRDNPLIVGQTRFETIEAMSALPAALELKIAEFEIDAARTFDCPTHLAEVVERGGRLWQQLQSLGSERPDPAVAEIVLDLFGRPRACGA
ncbi:MAG: nucleoside 2-deoxyribosyltransferase [Pirellulales bacterium]|nr:nucleoside 2-deoxyribosyltransferase [Pirellulales bacterium]